MNIDGIATKFVAGVVVVAVLTTTFGRSNTPRVLDALGRLGSGMLSAAMGKGADLR